MSPPVLPVTAQPFFAARNESDGDTCTAIRLWNEIEGWIKTDMRRDNTVEEDDLEMEHIKAGLEADAPRNRDTALRVLAMRRVRIDNRRSHRIDQAIKLQALKAPRVGQAIQTNNFFDTAETRDKFRAIRESGGPDGEAQAAEDIGVPGTDDKDVGFAGDGALEDGIVDSGGQESLE